MLKIYTSFYDNINKLRKDGISCVCISNGNPYNLQKYYPLVPKWWFVEKYLYGKMNEEEYTIEYLKQLTNNVNKSVLTRYFKDLKNDTAYLCFEKPPKFCHRHIFAKWYNESKSDTGIEIKEYDY